VVSLYNVANGYMVEAPGGRPFGNVAEVRINNTGRYFAVVRGAAGQGGLMLWYTLRGASLADEQHRLPKPANGQPRPANRRRRKATIRSAFRSP
jgi:hypothetical protein